MSAGCFSSPLPNKSSPPLPILMILDGMWYLVLENTNKETLRWYQKNGLINLQFLQELSRQKPFWDEARLSSLVNKRCDFLVLLVTFGYLCEFFFTFGTFWYFCVHLVLFGTFWYFWYFCIFLGTFHIDKGFQVCFQNTSIMIHFCIAVFLSLKIKDMNKVTLLPWYFYPYTESGQGRSHFSKDSWVQLPNISLMPIQTKIVAVTFIKALPLSVRHKKLDIKTCSISCLATKKLK